MKYVGPDPLERNSSIVLEQISGMDINKQVVRNIRDLLKSDFINYSVSLQAIQQKRIVTTAAGKHLLSTDHLFWMKQEINELYVMLGDCPLFSMVIYQI